MLLNLLFTASNLVPSALAAPKEAAPSNTVLQVVSAGRTFKNGDQIAVFDVPRLKRTDGSTPDWLTAWNADAERTLYGLENGQTAKDFAKSIPARFKQGEGVLRGEYVGSSYRVLMNRGAFLSIELCSEGFGAYPSSSCEERRVRGDTGATWTWDDAFLPGQRPAFLEACAKVLAPAIEAQQKEWNASGEDWSALIAEYPGLAPTDCAALPFEPATDGYGLTFKVDAELPHVIAAAAWSFTVPAAEIAAFIAQDGPLGMLVPATAPTTPR